MKTTPAIAEKQINVAQIDLGKDLPNIASESLQAQFIELCSGLGLGPRQAVLLGHIWLARAECQQQLVSDSIAGFIEFSPDVLPCQGQCSRHKVIFGSEKTE
ncbi:hypothetical protein SDC9_69585 [bioreactor metagenome]|uniref:Uncharacterized protein n=1 Tax=bioreactor metagenome TaxID=1076179 RepID=A0A644Y5A0_9ZZZZ